MTLNNLIIFINQFFKYTFVMYVKNKFKKQPKLDLNEVSSFWKKLDTKANYKLGKKTILVECMETLNINWNTTYSFLPILSKKFNISIVALSSYGTYKTTVDFLSKFYDVNKIESVYKPFDFITKFKAWKILLENLPFIYNLENGYKLIIYDVDIGDLVYDEYLRIARVETLRKPTLLYKLVCLNAIYQHLRFIEIIHKFEITDIVALRDTYSHSSFYRVRTGITIWKNIMSPNSVIVRKISSNTRFNYKPQYFDLKHLEYIKNNFTKKEIENIYTHIIIERKSNQVNSSIDTREMALAHTNHDIISKSALFNAYDIDKNKKIVVIYAHVFVDAVRYCHQTIFSDYYTWLIETLNFLLLNKDCNILVKPHPSEVLYNLGENVQSVIQRINKNNKNRIIYLDKKVDADLIYKITDVIVTASGTIGVEAPCEGVKVITAGTTMYENTNATFKSKSQKEYFELLNNFETLPRLTEEQKLNSKIGFIWINKLIYVQSKIYNHLKGKTINQKCKELNSYYKQAKLTDIDEIVERLYNDDFN